MKGYWSQCGTVMCDFIVRDNIFIFYAWSWGWMIEAIKKRDWILKLLFVMKFFRIFQLDIFVGDFVIYWLQHRIDVNETFWIIMMCTYHSQLQLELKDVHCWFFVDVCLPAFIGNRHQHQNDVNWVLLDIVNALIIFSASVWADNCPFCEFIEFCCQLS